MMRRLFLFGTALFWAALGGFWLNALWAPAAPVVVSAPAEATYTLAQVTEHAGETSCWMSIDGQVYDITAYLPEHPSRPAVILAWCGKEASEAYRTKMRGRPHSEEADQMLTGYRIGRLIDQ